MTVASFGTFAFAPTAVMTPFAKTIVPFEIGAEVTGTIVALRIANVPFLPGLLMTTDCAKRESDNSVIPTLSAAKRRNPLRMRGSRTFRVSSMGVPRLAASARDDTHCDALLIFLLLRVVLRFRFLVGL